MSGPSRHSSSEPFARSSGALHPCLPKRSEATAYFTNTSCGRQSVQGLSIGWGDQYTKSTSGQELSIADLDPGSYCYASTTDPGEDLVERVETDNSDSIRLTLGNTDPALETVDKGLPGC